MDNFKNLIMIKNFSYEEFLKIKEYLINNFNHDFILDYFSDDENSILINNINESISESQFFPQEQRLDYFLKTSDPNKESFVFINSKSNDNIISIIKNFPFKKEKKIIFFTLTEQNKTWKLKDLFNHLKEEYYKKNKK